MSDKKKKKDKDAAENEATSNVKEQNTSDGSCSEETKKTDAKDEELEKLKVELAQSKDTFLRLAADFENYKKRAAAEKLSLRSLVVSDTLQMMLPILDNLERALEAAKESSALKDGVEMTLEQAKTAFEKYGVTMFGERGDDFDPEKHNAVMTLDDAEIESGKIAKVLQRGYRIGDKIIRHALVAVAN